MSLTASSLAELAICVTAPQESSMNSEGLLMMNTSARRGLHAGEAVPAPLKDSSKGSEKYITTDTLKPCDISQSLRKIRVRVDSGNRAWHEGLTRMLANHAGLEMLDDGVNEIFRIEKILEDSPDVLLLIFWGNITGEF